MNVQPRLTGITTPSPETLQKLLNIKYGRANGSLSEIYTHNASQLVELQEREGYEIVSDGQYAAGDPFRPVYEGMEGVQIGSQTRWYETNGFCFPPQIVGELKAGTPIEYWSKTIESNKKSTVTLPGPYT